MQATKLEVKIDTRWNFLGQLKNLQSLDQIKGKVLFIL